MNFCFVSIVNLITIFWMFMYVHIYNCKLHTLEFCNKMFTWYLQNWLNTCFSSSRKPSFYCFVFSEGMHIQNNITQMTSIWLPSLLLIWFPLCMKSLSLNNNNNNKNNLLLFIYYSITTKMYNHMLIHCDPYSIWPQNLTYTLLIHLILYCVNLTWLYSVFVKFGVIRYSYDSLFCWKINE